MRSLSKQERPREKFILQGSKRLSDAELLAILLGSGSQDASAIELAREILHSCQHDLQRLARLGVQGLCKFKGVGPAKAVTIAAAIELGSRTQKSAGQQDSKVIRSSADVYQLCSHQFSNLVHEEFRVLYLNRRNAVQLDKPISKGGISGTVADPKIIIGTALEQKSSALVLMHNHPSGNLKPSEADKMLTKKIANAAQFLDLKVLDHLIFTDSGFFSFADEGLL